MKKLVFFCVIFTACTNTPQQPNVTIWGNEKEGFTVQASKGEKNFSKWSDDASDTTAMRAEAVQWYAQIK